MSKTRDVIDYAKRHGGVITTREALDVGISGSTLDRRVADGVFVRIGRGILAFPGTSSRPDALMRAAGRMLGAVISHHSAGRIHGFQPIPEAPPTVTVPYRGTHSFPGLVVHQSTDLLPQHVMGVRALRVTNPQRTVLDLAQVLGDSRLESVIDNALAGGMVDLADLVDLYLALTEWKKGDATSWSDPLRQSRRGESLRDSDRDEVISVAARRWATHSNQAIPRTVVGTDQRTRRLRLRRRGDHPRSRQSTLASDIRGVRHRQTARHRRPARGVDRPEVHLEDDHQ